MLIIPGFVVSVEQRERLLSGGDEHDPFVCDEVPGEANAGSGDGRDRWPEVPQLRSRRTVQCDVGGDSHINDESNAARCHKADDFQRIAFVLEFERPASVQDVAVRSRGYERNHLENGEIETAVMTPPGGEDQNVQHCKIDYGVE